MLIRLAILSLLLCQCGYNWGHKTRQLPGGHRTVHVSMFTNQTQMIGLEAVFTQALTVQLERSGFAVVTSKEAAELIVMGSLISAQNAGGGSDPSFDAKDFTSPNPNDRRSIPYEASFFTEYSLTITANLSAIRARDNKQIWAASVNGSDRYYAAYLKKQGIRSSNVLYNESRKKQTVKTIANEMMSEAFDRMTENF